MEAKPCKLKDDSWGVFVDGTCAVGDEVTVVTKSGKSWVSYVKRVLWSENGQSICSTERLSPVSPPSSTEPAKAVPDDDELPF